MPTGTILVDAPGPSAAEGAVLYARVSSADHKSDLDRQVARPSAFAAERDPSVAEWLPRLKWTERPP